MATEREFRIVERFADAKRAGHATAARPGARALAGRVADWHRGGLAANAALLVMLHSISEERSEEEAI